MNKGELIAGMAEESGVSKADTEKVLNAFLSQVEKALCAGDKVQLTGFGSFEVKERAERTGRNPKTNEPDRKSTRLNSSHVALSRMPSSA